jgi:hypothetical protein
MQLIIRIQQQQWPCQRQRAKLIQMMTWQQLWGSFCCRSKQMAHQQQLHLLLHTKVVKHICYSNSGMNVKRLWSQRTATTAAAALVLMWRVQTTIAATGSAAATTGNSHLQLMRLQRHHPLDGGCQVSQPL